jgi:predicted DsbA family dithiol-disulfide isomerase
MEAAMKIAASHPRTSHLDFEIKWRPFQLDDSLPFVGVNKLEMYKAKYGQRVLEMLPMMLDTGKKLTPPVLFSYGGKIANTLTSHTILNRALEEGGPSLQDKVVEGLFKHYFTNEGDLADREKILDIGTDAGMNKDKLKALLSEEENARARELIKIEEMQWKRKFRISGVPFFIFNKKYSLSGAQEAVAFLDIFAQIDDE